MYLVDLLWLAGKNVLRAGVRTRLCVLAICVGIASVSSVLSFGLLAAETVQGEMNRIGIGGVAFYHKRGESVSDTAIETITNASDVQAAMPLAITSGTIQLRNLRSTAGILGVDECLKDVFHLEVCHGSLPNAAQVRSASKTVVIDAELAQKVYHRTNVVGKPVYITVNGIMEKMEVCAVIRSQSSGLSMMFGGKLPHLIYLPYTTLQTMDPTVQTDKLIASMNDSRDKAQQLLEKLDRRHPQTYEYENLNQYLDSFSTITDVVALLIGGIAGISVVVGGIGVMNAMVSSLDARTREIGIYRALGAKKREIVRTFLFEALLQCLAGGLFGIACSYLFVYALQLIFGISLGFQRECILISLAISAICGVVFGFLPALRAAKLDPIQAIRSE